MKAIVQSGYGGPDVYELRDVDAPELADDEVLVRMRAASLHPDVWHVMRGHPYLLRVMGSGLRAPKYRIPGTDVAGVIEKVGGEVTRFEPGDAVFGEVVRGNQWRNGGAFAELVAAPASALAAKPARLSFEEAAALPTSGLIALQGVRREGLVAADDRVLINGAAGGVGQLAVQIATAAGAHVTAVDRTDTVPLLHSIGADEVIDYTAEDFTRSDHRYDLIVDIPGNRSVDDLKRVLTDHGRYVLIGHEAFDHTSGRWIGRSLARMIKLVALAPFGRGRTGKARPAEGDDPIATLAEMAAAGQLRPVIGRTYRLSEIADAIDDLQSGASVGRIVITP